MGFDLVAVHDQVDVQVAFLVFLDLVVEKGVLLEVRVGEVVFHLSADL